ncbi:MAG: hypothetical protein ACXWQO_06670 [Bdellovibrionota bacterium]
MPKNNTNSIIFVSPGEYFHGAVSGAVASLKVEVSDHAKLYIAQLLGQFISIDQFYPKDSEGNPADTLTEQLKNALAEEEARARALRLKQLGDFSLYIAGFFTDSLSRKLVDVDYYIGMGGAAYENAARLEKKAKAELFLELSRKFPQFVEILAQISEETGFNPENHRDLLRVYDLWAKTGSERLAKQLAKAGIVAPLKKPGDSQEDS